MLTDEKSRIPPVSLCHIIGAWSIIAYFLIYYPSTLVQRRSSTEIYEDRLV